MGDIRNEAGFLGGELQVYFFVDFGEHVVQAVGLDDAVWVCCDDFADDVEEVGFGK